MGESESYEQLEHESDEKRVQKTLDSACRSVGRWLKSVGWDVIAEEGVEISPHDPTASRCSTISPSEAHFLLHLKGSVACTVTVAVTEDEFRSRLPELRANQLPEQRPVRADPIPFRFQVFEERVRLWNFVSRHPKPQELADLWSPTELEERLRLSFVLSALTFNNGQSIAVEVDSILVLVGPNNSGKSSTLHEIVSRLESGKIGPVLKDVEYELNGSLDLLRSWLRQNLHCSQPPGHSLTYSWVNFSVNEASLSKLWQQIPSKHLQSLVNVFCSLAKTEDRLTIAKTSNAHQSYQQPPQNPVQSLFENEELERLLSEKCQSLFGQEVIVNRGSGSQIPLHFGERPQLESGEDRVSRGYVERLWRIPALQDQGDGIRSFMGTLLLALTSPAFVRLVDEPEAFLHPPQARQLGAILGSELKKAGGQLIIATHSGDLLRGLLDSQAEDLKIVRLRRKDNIAEPSELHPDEVKALWSDPILRFSNTLDGLFHEAVVICEDDADCRFFSAIVQSLVGNREERKRPDVMFAACGGKHRIKKIAPALTGVGVPTSAIVDFDVLDDETTVKGIVEGLGHEWSGIQPDWRIVYSAIQGNSVLLNRNQVEQGIREILDDLPTQVVTEEASQRIRDILKQVSPWKRAKDSGLAAVPKGQASEAAERLLEKLQGVGLFVVPCGEMEGFVRSIGGHGTKWVSSVLGRDLSQDPELESARNFVSQLLDRMIST